MVAYPEIQTKVQEEIDSVVGKFMFILFVPLSGIGLQFLVVSLSPVRLCLGVVPRPWPFLVIHCIYVYFYSINICEGCAFRSKVPDILVFSRKKKKKKKKKQKQAFGF